MHMTIPLWYGGVCALAAAYFGFWFGRSRNWGLLGGTKETEETGENRHKGTKVSEKALSRAKYLASPASGTVEELSDEDKLTVQSARKVQRFLSQPFAVAQQFTGVPGVMVSIEDTIRGFNMIMDGACDDMPEQAFLNVGTIEEAIEKARKIKEQVG